MREYIESSVFIGRRENALLSWALTAYIAVTTANIFLDGNLAWAGFSLSLLGLILLPVLATKDYRNLAPFEVLLLVSVPLTLKGVEFGFLASHTLSYLSAAATALMVFTELDSFTEFKITPRFSLLLVPMTTVAVAGAWAVLRWLMNSSMPALNPLMWEFAAALLAGLISALLFSMYFKRRDRVIEE